VTEEERAAEYRRQQRAQDANRRARLAALAGSRTAGNELRDAWRPVALWLRERRRDGDR
jgi:hypothetical protein